MTAMGALNLKVDARTQERFRTIAGETNPEQHRRRTISLALGNIEQNVRGLLAENRSRRNAPTMRARGIGRGRSRNLNVEHLPNGRVMCNVCTRSYAPSSINRYVLRKCI